jgi:hypothetical protein
MLEENTADQFWIQIAATVATWHRSALMVQEACSIASYDAGSAPAISTAPQCQQRAQVQHTEHITVECDCKDAAGRLYWLRHGPGILRYLPVASIDSTMQYSL